MNPETPAIDDTALNTLKESLGDDAVIRQLIELYIKDSPAQLAAARNALAAGDSAVLARAAHSLKSTSASMGALRVLAAAKALEAQAKSGDLAQSALLLGELEIEFDHAQTALQEKMA